METENKKTLTLRQLRKIRGGAGTLTSGITGKLPPSHDPIDSKPPVKPPITSPKDLRSFV
jgi:hypothetical protein